MSLSSIAQDSALRLKATAAVQPDVQTVAERAGQAAFDASSGGEAPEQVAQAAKDAAQEVAVEAGTLPATVSSGPLAQLVKYIPTETITLYVAVEAALGSDSNFTGRWVAVAVMLILTILLALGLSYRAQREADNSTGFRFAVPWFETVAAAVAFLIWSLSLPNTPLRGIDGFDYSAWNSVIILGGTILIALASYVFGQNVNWKKVYDPNA